MRLVTGARLRLWRDRDEEAARSFRQDGGGPFVFGVPADLLAGEGVMGYRIEVLGAADAVLASVEHEVRLVDAVELDETPEPGRAAAARRAETPRPFYRTWWFWTAVGAVVAGVAVGTGVGLAAGRDGIDFGRPEVVRAP